MNILRTFENNLEGTIDGLFARLFRSGLQPIELAKAIQRYQANYQQAGPNGAIVSNVFRFTLSPEDLERFSSFTMSLQRELADVARATADERGWRTMGPIRIEFERSDDIKPGTFELRGKTESARQQAKAAPAQPAPARRRDNSRISVRAIEGADAGKTWTIEREGLIGRLPECDIVLTGPSVSRRHARLVLDHEVWRIEDLGSTNGIKVNGSATQGASLKENDRIEVGGVTFTLTGV